MTLLRNAICRKISAHALDVKQAPATLLRHNRLSPNDKIFWDASYSEEYFGLQDLGTWKVISEKEYEKLKPIVGNALPSMAISTIKKIRMEIPSGVNIASLSLVTLIPTIGRKAIALYQSYLNLNCDYFSQLLSPNVAFQKQPMSPKPSSNLSFQTMNPTLSNHQLDVPSLNPTHTYVS